MDLVKANLYKEEGTFCYELHENASFSKDKFFELFYYIRSQNLAIEEEERKKVSLEIWELAFSIQQMLTVHCNELDAFKVSGLNNDNIASLGNVLMYLANSFSYNKPIDPNLVIESW